MNNYLSILNFLRPHAGDTRFHNIERLLNDLGLKQERAKEEVLKDLSSLKYIHYQGGTKGGWGIVSLEDYPNADPSHRWYEEYVAKITIEGVTYLKEDLQMEKSGAYNVTVTGNQNQLIVGSTHVNINAQHQIQELVDKAIEVINDTDLRNRDAYIETLRQLQKEVAQGEVEKSTLRDTLELSNQVSGIGSFIMPILTQLQIFG